MLVQNLVFTLRRMFKPGQKLMTIENRKLSLLSCYSVVRKSSRTPSFSEVLSVTHNHRVYILCEGQAHLGSCG